MDISRNNSYQIITTIELCSKDDELGKTCDFIISKFKEHPKFQNCEYHFEIKKEKGLCYISGLLYVVQ